VAAVRETIRTALTVTQDLKENAGQLH